jgi:transposase
MLSLSGYRLVLWNSAADMRQGINGLSGIVSNHMREDPFKTGTIYGFFNQRRNQVKLLVWEQDGFAIYFKRLSKGTFGTPVYDANTEMMVVSKKDLMLILEGVEIKYRKWYNVNEHTLN